MIWSARLFFRDLEEVILKVSTHDTVITARALLWFHRATVKLYFVILEEIPKTIRTNFTALILFEIGNEKELEVIYEEFAMGLKRDDWMELYKYAISEDYGFLFINFQKEKRMRLMKCFHEYLFVSPE